MTDDLRPLAGYRVVDFSVAWAGPFGSMLLADLGAEVIKVENVHVWQPHTRNWRARPTREELRDTSPIISGHPYGEPGDRPWERSAGYFTLHRNKKSVTINARSPRGMEYVRRLVEVSDVVYDNNVPETLEKLGITWEAIHGWNPRAIMFRAPAFGLSGAYRNFRAWGTHIEAVICHTLLRGYPDMDPSANTSVYAGDFQTGVTGAFAVMAALLYRERSGKGQLIELSQAENGIALFPQAMMDWILNGRTQTTTGNRGIHGEAPSGVYRCQADSWIAIDVCDDTQWQVLATEIGQPGLSSDARFASAEGRRAHMDELDALISAWTLGQDATAVMRRLQAGSVPAGEVQRADQAYFCPHLRDRGYFEPVDSKHVGRWEIPGFMFKLPASELVMNAPTGLGEYNEYVYKEILGVSDAEYDDLVASGEVGEEFDANIR